MKSLFCALIATVAASALSVALGLLVDAAMVSLGAYTGSLWTPLIAYGTTNLVSWLAGVCIAAAIVHSADRKQTVLILVGAVIILFAIRAAAVWHAHPVELELFIGGGAAMSIASIGGILLGSRCLRHRNEDRFVQSG